MLWTNKQTTEISVQYFSLKLRCLVIARYFDYRLLKAKKTFGQQWWLLSFHTITGCVRIPLTHPDRCPVRMQARKCGLVRHAWKTCTKLLTVFLLFVRGAVWSTPSCMFLQTVARLMSRRSPINLSVTQTSLSTRCWTFSALFLFRAFDSPPTIWITSKVLKPLPESFKQFEATLMRWNLASVNNYKHFSCFCNWFSQI
jgi:hypothetical protein